MHANVSSGERFTATVLDALTDATAAELGAAEADRDGATGTVVSAFAKAWTRADTVADGIAELIPCDAPPAHDVASSAAPIPIAPAAIT